MFRIDYDVRTASFSELERITDEEVRYNFLLGNIVFSNDFVKIYMEWEWIPLLDFSLSLLDIVEMLETKEKHSEYFDFTESADTLEFSKNECKLKIIPSFSAKIMEVTFDEFHSEVKEFNNSICVYIKQKVGNKTISKVLIEYLSI